MHLALLALGMVRVRAISHKRRFTKTNNRIGYLKDKSWPKQTEQWNLKKEIGERKKYEADYALLSTSTFGSKTRQSSSLISQKKSNPLQSLFTEYYIFEFLPCLSSQCQTLAWLATANQYKIKILVPLSTRDETKCHKRKAQLLISTS